MKAETWKPIPVRVPASAGPNAKPVPPQPALCPINALQKDQENLRREFSKSKEYLATYGEAAYVGAALLGQVVEEVGAEIEARNPELLTKVKKHISMLQRWRSEEHVMNGVLEAAIKESQEEARWQKEFPSFGDREVTASPKRRKTSGPSLQMSHLGAETKDVVMSDSGGEGHQGRDELSKGGGGGPTSAAASHGGVAQHQ